MKKTLWGLLALSALSLMPLLQAEPTEEQPRLEQLKNELLEQARILGTDMPSIVREGTTLRVLSQDVNLRMRVAHFNRTFQEFLSEYKRRHQCSDAQLVEMLGNTAFSRLPKAATFEPNAELPTSQRWLVLEGAPCYSDSQADTPAPEPPLPLTLCYAKPDALPEGADSNTRIALYRSAWLDTRGDAPLGWVPSQHLLRWNHNIVLRLRAPQQRSISLADSAPYAPHVLFYTEPGDDATPRGATGPFNLQDGLSAEGKRKVAMYLHNYQMSIGAAEKDAGFSEEQAREFQDKFGVELVLPAAADSAQLFLPVIKAGSSSYTGAGRQETHPLQVMLLEMPGATSAGAQEETEHTVELCIVMDLSGNAEKMLNGLRECLSKLLGQMPAGQLGKMRLGFIGYRDIPTHYKGGKRTVLEGLKFHGRSDGLREDYAPVYNYTHRGMLKPDEFLKLLDDVKSPRGELQAAGLPEAEQQQELENLRHMDDVPDRLFAALDAARNTYSQGDTALKFLILMGDAPDKSAFKADQGLKEAACIHAIAMDARVHMLPVFLDNEGYAGRQAVFRHIGRQQFTALGGSARASVVPIDKEGNIKGESSYADIFDATLGQLFHESTSLPVKPAATPLPEFKAKVCWVTEHDPLALAAGADAKKAVIFDLYALMTRPQLEKWLEVASALYLRMTCVESDQEAELFDAMAALFLSGAYSADEVARTYGTAEWGKLRKRVEAELPCSSPFMDNFFRFQNGESVNYDFASELDAFGRGIAHLRSLLNDERLTRPENGATHQPAPGNTPQPDDRKLYLVPLKYFP